MIDIWLGHNPMSL